MSGGEAHVENSIWMRAVVWGGVFLVVGVLAFATMGVGVANLKHHDYEDALHEYDEAKEVYYDAKNAYELAEGDNNTTAAELSALKTAKDEAKAAYDEAHHHEIEAHLSYLTWRTAGVTILLMCITYAAFLALGGFVNSIQPSDDHGHDDHHYGGDDHEHHGSGSPIVFSLGIMLFLMGFPKFQAVLSNMLSGEEFMLGDLGVSMIGLTVITLGIANWWREDLPFIGNGEQIATSAPFEGQHIRKAGLWVFIMSEIMVFATFFSSYLRMRTGWCTKWSYDEGTCREFPNMVINSHEEHPDFVMTASDYLRPDGAAGTGDFWTMLPGAVNTFALIISSYTIVLALKTAKAKNWEAPKGALGKLMPTQKAAVRNYLLATFLLGSMFIVLKLIEWSHLVAEGFTIGTQAGSIFYISTGAHGLHVFVGLLVMLYLVFKADTVGYDENNGQGIEYFGLYWHFVDLAWVVIFPAFYLY
jgi:heme/copper-type cytochrome/quinol oxidase subunit 3